MKHIFAGIAVVLLMLTSCSSGEDKGDNSSTSGNQSNSSSTTQKIEPGSPEEFASVLANFVIDSNYAGIDSLIIRHDEMKDVISGSNVTPQGKEAAISHIDTEIGKMKNDMINGLKDVRSKGAQNNIIWMASTFKESHYSIAKPNGYEMMQMTCVIDFNGVEYPFTVTDVVHTANGWKLGGKMFFGSNQH